VPAPVMMVNTWRQGVRTTEMIKLERGLDLGSDKVMWDCHGGPSRGSDGGLGSHPYQEQ
jgi:hypothetical protein